MVLPTCRIALLVLTLCTLHVQVARTAGIDTNDCNSCRLSVSGAFGLSDEDMTLYNSCDKTGKGPDGRDCTGIEKQCYRCYCYTSVTSGRLRYGTGQPSLEVLP